MAIGVFPVLKLGVLLIKQISKPLAKLIVNQAKNHPVFRTYFIIPPAQFYHWAEVKGKMYMMNLGKPTKVAKLNEAMAIELGSNLMGEVIIFSLAGGCLIFEYNRQVAKEIKKEEARNAQIQEFKNNIESLQNNSTRLQSDINYLQDVIKELAKRTKYQLPEQPVLTEIVEKVDQSQSTNTTTISTEATDNNTEVKKSLVQRAITYYENNVKADR
ncbi:PREDICTED: optic atrophy 3 protein homolog [Polistes dominula]|uniref:Optic atrophy 3 protein homolog n=1 Tax=Polistes dominula TaxID=743375 RepID=A0ABM1I807_POLDO|nr:PREDICTED: optic atrophy 3 protein homolog [Polistes dominula]XP_015176345.1 PREDICTED: optic atrophy 3 protein homolog [Polistes dominula]